MILADNSAIVIQLLLGGFGLSGIVGAVVAIYKLRPDVNSAAVVQAQGAMEGMESLITETRSDRDYWRKRALDAENECTRRTEAIEKERQRLSDALATERQHFQDMIKGMRLWDDEHPPPHHPD